MAKNAQAFVLIRILFELYIVLSLCFLDSDSVEFRVSKLQKSNNI